MHPLGSPEDLLVKPDANLVNPTPSDAASDEIYVERVQRGDTDAFEILVRRHQKTVFNLAYRMIGDYEEATEVAQEVFLSAFKYIRQFRKDAKFSTWLYRIALNQGSTQRKSVASRRQRTVSLVNMEPVDASMRDPALLVANKEIQFHIQSAIGGLAPDHAAVVVLIDMQGASYETAADVLQIRIDTVKTRLHRARQALKIKLLPILRERNLL